MLYQAFVRILHMSVMALAVIVVVLILRIVLRRLPRKYLYLMWLIVGIRLVCPFAISSPVSLFNVVHPDIRQDYEEKMEAGLGDISPVVFTDEDHAANVSEVPDTASVKKNSTGDLQAPAKKTAAPLVRYGTVVWLAGMILIFLWSIRMLYRTKKNLRKAVLYQKNIYECDNIPSPFAMGVFRPKIYIPFRLEAEERIYILKHEQHHIRRGDHLIRFFAFVLAGIYWFHPLVWLSYFFMIQDMEMSCDEYVLQSMPGDIRIDYSKSLLGFAMNQRKLVVGNLAFGETNTRKRVKNVMNFRKPAAWAGAAAILILVVAGVTCLTNGKENNSKTDNGSDDRTVEKSVLEPYESVIASTQIHGYELQFVYSPADKKQNQMNNGFDDLYEGNEGDFELRTSKDDVLCARLPFQPDSDAQGDPKYYFPVKGFDFTVKDYDGDGHKDDFFLADTGSHPQFSSGVVGHWLYTVEEDGSIWLCKLSIKNSPKNYNYFITLPTARCSDDFEYVDGEILNRRCIDDDMRAAEVIGVVPQD